MNNCICWALPRWIKRGAAGEETYLIFRLSRIRWGFFHCLLGVRDPATGQIAVKSYKPPSGHVKHKPAPIFNGSVVDGDEVTKPGDLT